jgi:hypothetical protein
MEAALRGHPDLLPGANGLHAPKRRLEQHSQPIRGRAGLTPRDPGSALIGQQLPLLAPPDPVSVTRFPHGEPIVELAHGNLPPGLPAWSVLRNVLVATAIRGVATGSAAEPSRPSALSWLQRDPA